MFPINSLVVKNMKKIIMIASLVLSVTACESLYEANDDGIPRIRSQSCLLYTSPSPRDGLLSRMPSSA